MVHKNHGNLLIKSIILHFEAELILAFFRLLGVLGVPIGVESLIAGFRLLAFAAEMNLAVRIAQTVGITGFKVRSGVDGDLDGWLVGRHSRMNELELKT